MKINKMSFEELNNVNLHDKIIQDFHFDRLTKRLVIPILPENEYDHNDEVHEMEFLNVLGLEITACDFWCPSPHVLSVSALSKDEENLIPKYLENWCAPNDPFHTAKNFPGENCFEVLVEFTSGDTLSIVCEELIIK